MAEIVPNVKTGERRDIIVIFEFVQSLKDKIATVVTPYKLKANDKWKGDPVAMELSF